MNSVILLTMMVGQLPQSPAPTTVIDYLYGTAPVKTKVIAEIRYNDGRLWRVPVVNGYMPKIAVTRLPTGGWHYVLDYRSKMPYRVVTLPESEPQPQSTQVPRSASVLRKPSQSKLPDVNTKAEPPTKLDGLLVPSDIGDPIRIIRPDYEKSER